MSAKIGRSRNSRGKSEAISDDQITTKKHTTKVAEEWQSKQHPRQLPGETVVRIIGSDFLALHQLLSYGDVAVVKVPTDLGEMQGIVGEEMASGGDRLSGGVDGVKYTWRLKPFFFFSNSEFTETLFKGNG
jgi:hypothetical protein